MRRLRRVQSKSFHHSKVETAIESRAFRFLDINDTAIPDPSLSRCTRVRVGVDRSCINFATCHDPRDVATS